MTRIKEVVWDISSLGSLFDFHLRFYRISDVIVAQIS